MSLSANAVEATTTVSMTDTFEDNAALIGGIVGGIVTLLLIVGLIAFFVSRRNRRRSNNSPQARNSVAMAPTQASSSSDYGTIEAVKPITGSNVYDESFLKHTPGTPYDSASVLANNNYTNMTMNNEQ
jgi:hypothetical protein